MIMDAKKWYQSKTVWTGIAGAIGAIAGVLTGGIDGGQGAQLLITSLLGIFIRTGISREVGN